MPHCLELLLVLFWTSLSYSQSSFINQQCTLPSGNEQSICVQFSNCKYFSDQIPKGSTLLNRDTHDEMVEHNANCGKSLKNGLVCCPSVIPPPNDTKDSFEYLKLHRNFHLINVNCGRNQPPDRLVGGSEARLRELPWMALLGYRSEEKDKIEYKCGGSLITNSVVLTAAHCIRPDLVKVRLGEHDTSEDLDCDDHDLCMDPVQDFDFNGFHAIKHPKYTEAKKVNDIAVIQLSTPADTSKKNVKPICLPMTDDVQIDKIEQMFRDNMVLAGWGTVESGQTSNVPMKAGFKFITNAECNVEFEQFSRIKIEKTQMCAQGKENADACAGDSGGALHTLAYFGRFPRKTLYGVYKGGIGCNKNLRKTFPGIFTNISFYLEWILDNLTPKRN